MEPVPISQVKIEPAPPKERKASLFNDIAGDTVEPISQAELRRVEAKAAGRRIGKKIFFGFEKGKTVFFLVEPIFRAVAYVYLFYKMLS